MSRRRSGPGRALIFALALLAGPVPGGMAVAGDKPPAVPAATPSQDAHEEKPPPYFRARVVVRELTEAGETSRSFRIYKRGNMVRLEGENVADERFTDATLYDYDRGESYREIVGGDMIFSYRVSIKERIRARIYGFMAMAEGPDVHRREVNPDVIFDGHPCTLVQRGFRTPGRIHALHWALEANDLAGQPIKVVFPRGDGGLEIIEYLEASGEPFDDALVSLPDGVPVMSGF